MSPIATAFRCWPRCVAASQIEQLVTAALRQHLSKAPPDSTRVKQPKNTPRRPQSAATPGSTNQLSDGEIVRQHVSRVDVHHNHLLVHIHDNAEKDAEVQLRQRGAVAKSAKDVCKGTTIIGTPSFALFGANALRNCRARSFRSHNLKSAQPRGRSAPRHAPLSSEQSRVAAVGSTRSSTARL